MGKWAWTSDGKTHDYYIIFDKNNSCLFTDLDDMEISCESECNWKIHMKTL